MGYSFYISDSAREEILRRGYTEKEIQSLETQKSEEYNRQMLGNPCADYDFEAEPERLRSMIKNPLIYFPHKEKA